MLRLYGIVSFQRLCVHDNTVVVWVYVRVFRYSLAPLAVSRTRAEKKEIVRTRSQVNGGKPEGGVGRGGWRPMQRQELEFLGSPGCRGRAARANPMPLPLNFSFFPFFQVRW